MSPKALVTANTPPNLFITNFPPASLNHKKITEFGWLQIRYQLDANLLIFKHYYRQKGKHLSLLHVPYKELFWIPTTKSIRLWL